MRRLRALATVHRQREGRIVLAHGAVVLTALLVGLQVGAAGVGPALMGLLGIHAVLVGLSTAGFIRGQENQVTIYWIALVQAAGVMLLLVVKMGGPIGLSALLLGGAVVVAALLAMWRVLGRMAQAE